MSDELLNNVHKKITDKILRKDDPKNAGSGSENPLVREVIRCDQELRKTVAELFFALEKLNDPNIALRLLDEHVGILSEMLMQVKDFQKNR